MLPWLPPMSAIPPLILFVLEVEPMQASDAKIVFDVPTLNIAGQLLIQFLYILIRTRHIFLWIIFSFLTSVYPTDIHL